MLMGTMTNIIMAAEPAECMVPNFRNIHSHDMDFVGGYMAFMACYRSNQNAQDMPEQIGGAYKDALTEAGPWGMYMYMQGETIPKETNYVALSKDKKDEWGIPLLVTNVEV